MTKMFGNLKSTDTMEKAVDTVGGFAPIPSGAYPGEIVLVYAGAADSGAQNITIHFKTADGREVRETVYITNKKGENFYVDKQDATKQHPLPGFTTIDDICLLTTGESLTEQLTEEKTVKIYDYTERKEIPKPVQCLTALHGKPIILGILREVVDKEKKDDSGKYVPTGETREQNAIDKAFDSETHRTVNEYINGVETPEFYEAWAGKNTGKDRTKVKGKAASAGSSGSGRPGPAGAAGKSLFGKK